MFEPPLGLHCSALLGLLRCSALRSHKRLRSTRAFGNREPSLGEAEQSRAWVGCRVQHGCSSSSKAQPRLFPSTTTGGQQRVMASQALACPAVPFTGKAGLSADCRRGGCTAALWKGRAAANARGALWLFHWGGGGSACCSGEASLALTCTQNCLLVSGFWETATALAMLTACLPAGSGHTPVEQTDSPRHTGECVGSPLFLLLGSRFPSGLLLSWRPALRGLRGGGQAAQFGPLLPLCLWKAGWIEGLLPGTLNGEPESPAATSLGWGGGLASQSFG